MKAIKLKHDRHMDSGLMYCVYQNQGQGPIALGATSLDRFYNLPLMKKNCCTFLKNCKGYKVETWYTHGQWVDVLCVPELGPRVHNSRFKSLDRSYIALFPCPTMMLSDEHQFKIF